MFVIIMIKKLFEVTSETPRYDSYVICIDSDYYAELENGQRTITTKLNKAKVYSSYHEAALDLWHVERTVAIFAFRIEKYRGSDIIFICGVEE